MSRATPGVLLPHAPVILESVSGPELAPQTRAVRDAVRSIDLAGADAIVVVSPHGSASGVYGRPAGTLDGFGVTGIAVDAATDEGLVAEVAESWRRPVLDEDADHGILVPLCLLSPDVPVVAVAVVESSGPSAADPQVALGDALDLVEPLRACLRERNAVVCASVATSAGLSARAPLTLLDGADEVERRLLEALRGAPNELPALAEDAAVGAGSCSAGTLALFGALFAQRPARLVAYAAPFGVGYPVAVVDRA